MSIKKKQIDIPMELPLKLDLSFFTQMSLKFNCGRLADVVKKLAWPKSTSQPLTLSFDPDKSEIIRCDLRQSIRRTQLHVCVFEGY